MAAGVEAGHKAFRPWIPALGVCVLVGGSVAASCCDALSAHPWWLAMAATVWGIVDGDGHSCARSPERRVALAASIVLTCTVAGVVLAVLQALNPEYLYFRIVSAALLVGVGFFVASRVRRWEDIPVDGPVEHDVNDVVAAERAWLRIRRKAVTIATPRDMSASWPDVVGVALSGGGIRAAAVSSGFLRGLGEKGILRSVDYLSTVSGGGWAGGFLTTAWATPTNATEFQEGKIDWGRIWTPFKNRQGYLALSGRDGLARVGWIVRQTVLGVAVTIVTVAFVVLAVDVGLVLVSLKCGAQPTTCVLDGWIPGRDHLEWLFAVERSRCLWDHMEAVRLVPGVAVMTATGLALALVIKCVAMVTGMRTIRDYAEPAVRELAQWTVTAWPI